MEVPDSFPRDPKPALLSGSQLKLAVRLMDGKYVTGLTNAEREERYEYCADLVEQLLAYCRRKQVERPDEPLESLLRRVDLGLRAKGWTFSQIELDWCMTQVRKVLL